LKKNYEKSISFGEKKNGKAQIGPILSSSEMKMMHSFNEAKVDDKNMCDNCRNMEKKLFIAESKILNLQFENYKMKKALQNAITPNTNMVNSWSGFAPAFNEGDQIIAGHAPDSMSLNAGQLNLVQSDEMINKIEYLMGELTRMMDSLENVNNNVTGNYTGHFTNSTNLTNNNTYQLINSVNNINFNTTYTNILNSHNNSRVNPPISSNTNKEQILSSNPNHPTKENSKSFSGGGSAHKKDQNPNNNSENNGLSCPIDKSGFSARDKSGFSPRDKSENLQSQAISQFSIFFRDENSHSNN